MLVTDPRKRISIKDIVIHKWIRIGEEDSNFDTIVRMTMEDASHDKVDALNEQVLEQMENMGIDRGATELVSDLCTNLASYR